jgi:hypothetical protein
MKPSVIGKWIGGTVLAVLIVLVPIGLCCGQASAAQGDCKQLVELAKSDLRSAAASAKDGEYDTAVDLARQGVDRLEQALECDLGECKASAERAGCSEHLEAAEVAAQAACKDFLNAAWGDMTEHLATAAAAVTMWLDCVSQACSDK